MSAQTEPTTPPVVRPVRHSSSTHAWSVLLTALGTDAVEVRSCGQQDPQRGRTDLGFLVTDLPSARAALDPPGRVEAAGPAFHVALGDGTHWHLLEGDLTAPPVAATEVSVLPLWMTPDVDPACATFEALGLRPRFRAKAGTWADFTGTRGLAAVHESEDGTAEVVLAFEAPDLQTLAATLHAAGLRADVVDENYGRSLRIDDPDGGVELLVNETLQDLYGYELAGDAPA